MGNCCSAKFVHSISHDLEEVNQWIERHGVKDLEKFALLYSKHKNLIIGIVKVLEIMPVIGNKVLAIDEFVEHVYKNYPPLHHFLDFVNTELESIAKDDVLRYHKDAIPLTKNFALSQVDVTVRLDPIKAADGSTEARTTAVGKLAVHLPPSMVSMGTLDSGGLQSTFKITANMYKTHVTMDGTVLSNLKVKIGKVSVNLKDGNMFADVFFGSNDGFTLNISQQTTIHPNLADAPLTANATVQFSSKQHAYVANLEIVGPTPSLAELAKHFLGQSMYDNLPFKKKLDTVLDIQVTEGQVNVNVSKKILLVSGKDQENTTLVLAWLDIGGSSDENVCLLTSKNASRGGTWKSVAALHDAQLQLDLGPFKGSTSSISVTKTSSTT